MNPMEIARRVFPDPSISDDELGYLIWNCTGYPCFFSSDDPEKEMQEQLESVRDGTWKDPYPLDS